MPGTYGEMMAVLSNALNEIERKAVNIVPNKNDYRCDSPNYDEGEIQPFDGFPYYVTRIVPALYHVILLPTEWTEASLIDFAETQAGFNNLEACLALSQDHGLWFTPDGGKIHSHQIPAGGTLIKGGLKPCRDFHRSVEFEERARQLDACVQETRGRGGYIRGDPSHGGRAATDQEFEALSGMGFGGVPKGLAPCPTCGCLKGECLGTAERYKSSVLPVSCRCDNNNRCARCGSSFHEWKLSSNFFNPSDGHIWYVPGFACFGHRCPDLV